LQPLDDCLRSWVDAPDLLSAFLHGPFPIAKDREFGSGFVPTGERTAPVFADGEFVGKVVEGRAEVVDAVPGDEAETGGRGLDDFGIDDLLAALGIEFGPEFMRAFFKPGTPFRFKALQVVERPIEPPFVGPIHG